MPIFEARPVEPRPAAAARVVLSLLLVLLASRGSLSGEPAPRSPADTSSACVRALDFVAGDAARNYAGFSDKVNPATAGEYQGLLRRLRRASLGADGPTACLAVLRRWSAFFHDAHLRVQLRGPTDAAAAVDEIPASVARLDSRTILLRLRTFDSRDVDLIEGVIRTAARMSSRTETLIVDLRDNAGGSDFAWQALLPLVYTGPIVVVGTAFRSTPDNVSRLAAQLSEPALQGAQREWLEHAVEEMRAHPGQLVRRPDMTYRAERVLPYPKRVAVLVNRGCASSCEQLLIALRQSRKVTLYGEPTAGALDYSNLVATEIPGGELELIYPVSRSRRLPAEPVDGRGILPDVLVPAAASVDPTSRRFRALLRRGSAGLALGFHPSHHPDR